MTKLTRLMIALVALTVSSCAAIRFEQCTKSPDGSETCTKVSSRKDHPNGIKVSYDPKTGKIEYQSASSVTNTSDVAGLLELVRIISPIPDL